MRSKVCASLKCLMECLCEQQTKGEAVREGEGVEALLLRVTDQLCCCCLLQHVACVCWLVVWGVGGGVADAAVLLIVMLQVSHLCVS